MINYPVISSIILSICLLIILLSNLLIKRKILKYLFLIFSSIYLIIIIMLDNEFIYEFLKSIITYIWYPSYLIFVIVILISIAVLIITLLKKNKFINNILNYILFTICLGSYLIFLSLNIDPSLYSSLYQTNSLIVMRIVTISFFVWLLVSLFIRMRGKNEN